MFTDASPLHGTSEPALLSMGLLLRGFAIIHFIRRRPDVYWIYIILFLGALVYIFVEAVADIGQP